MAARYYATVGAILSAQFLIIVCVVGVYMLASGWQRAFSCLLGGCAAYVPSLYFAWQVSRSQGMEPRKIVRNFYFGESGKLLLTAVFFAIIFQLPNVEIIPLLVGYISALSVFWFALLMR